MDRITLDELFAKYTPLIRKYHSCRVRNSHDADDLVQETCCAIMDSYSRFRSESSVSTWVYAVCRNTFFNYLRGRKRRVQLDARVHAGQVMHKPYEMPVEIHEMPEYISVLSPVMRELYELHYRQGYLIREIARMTGRPEGSIKFMLHELRNTIRDSIIR
ncbi:MAG: sigma-70 family RNA polymerase sigma factor [Spirochaetes bacterium]|nr:sigma-70 family RNA polymerase sigma factor [Spirochaetota bacterium]